MTRILLPLAVLALVWWWRYDRDRLNHVMEGV